METPIIVTGATGFVGSRLVVRLHSKGYKVKALVLPQEKKLAETILPLGTEIVYGDVSNKKDVELALGGAKTIFHFAAIVKDWGSADLHSRVTIGGTSNVMAAASENNATLILCSSVVVYGDRIGRQECSEEIAFGKALGVYGNSKQYQEILAKEFEERRGLKVIIVRPTNIFGPNSGPWMNDLVKHLRSRMPSLVGNGNQNAGLCYVENFIDLLIMLANHPKAIGKVYNVCDNSDISWKQYFNDISKITKSPTPYGIPLWLARVGAGFSERVWKLLRLHTRPPITRESINLVGSNHNVPIKRAQNDLGYVPRVSYETAINEIRDWYQSH